MARLRPDQQRALNDTMRALTRSRRVCVVAPTGWGKTVLASALCERAIGSSKPMRVLFLAHRKELIHQAASRLRSGLPQLVGEIHPTAPDCPSCPVQVASIQTLLARDKRPPAELVIWDECHHVPSDTYTQLLSCYPSAFVVGLTATPERSDGRPLGDMFAEMVVATKYSELIAAGHLVDCKVYQPSELLGTNEVAQDPVKAYRELADGRLSFAFAPRIERCEELAEQFRDVGIESGVVSAGMAAGDREQMLRRFRRGEIRILWSVYALTEGVDVPEASAIILARGCGHAGMYLQMCGRVLRPFPGKDHALLIDLCGATLLHGLPTEDREYSLEGEAIRRTSKSELRVCPSCGATIEIYQRTCPECGFVVPKRELPSLVIYDQQLREVFRGPATPEEAKAREYRRLRQLGRERGWSLYFVQKEYKKLFGESPVIFDASEEEKIQELGRLRAIQRERGWKPGYVKVRFKETFGQWPHRGL